MLRLFGVDLKTCACTHTHFTCTFARTFMDAWLLMLVGKEGDCIILHEHQHELIGQAGAMIRIEFDGIRGKNI